MAFAGHFAMIPPLRTSSISPTAGLVVFLSGSATGVFFFAQDSASFPFAEPDHIRTIFASYAASMTTLRCHTVHPGLT